MSRSAIFLIVVAAFLILFFPFFVIQWIGFAVALVVIASFGYAISLDSGLQISRDAMDLTAYQLQTVDVEIKIKNSSFLPMPYLVVTDNPGSLYTGHENSRLISLRPREETSLRYHIRGMNRGAYRIGPITVRFSDPLGLFPVSRSIPEETRLIVYPRIHPVALPVHRGLPAGSITTSSRIYEDPTRYRSVREYVPGDEIRKINWKASARLGVLHSTEWLPTINVPVLIMLNLTAEDYLQRNRFAHTERTIDAAASNVNHLAERGQEVGLITTGVIKGFEDEPMPWIGVGSGAPHAVGILETLAQLVPNPRPADSVEVFLDRGRVSFGTRVFYMGPPLQPESVAALTSGIGDRSLVRLYYTDEGVRNWTELAVETMHIWRITEFGDELFTLQA
ncbi:MAG: DUF58 domain-containing protein [Spirochaetales bacterium]|nr:MAG: DUF58 domain-containing protein [Spirochaetales bacterium]